MLLLAVASIGLNHTAMVVLQNFYKQQPHPCYYCFAYPSHLSRFESRKNIYTQLLKIENFLVSVNITCFSNKKRFLTTTKDLEIS